MKLHNSSEKITNTGFKKKAYTIKESPKAFLILSSSLYSDKPKAIIRELSTNALDSHIESNIERPIKVVLPTHDIPTLTIRDYGKGLSPKQIETVYTVYFESTKETSNDFIGALGLGSKSPFSYTNSFNVTSYQPEYINTYLVCIDNGEPCVYTISENQIPNTTNETGLEVSIEIEPSDYNLFSRAASKVFTFFDEGSVHIEWQNGTKMEKPSWKNNIKVGYVEFDSNHLHRHTFFAKMGPVAYEIDNSMFDFKLVGLLNTGHVFEFEMGELEFQPSREALSYNQQTIKAINDKIEIVSNSLLVELQQVLEGSNSLREAIVRIKNLKHRNTQGLYKFLTFKGKTIAKHLEEYSNQYSNINKKHSSHPRYYDTTRGLAYPTLKSNYILYNYETENDAVFIVRTTQFPIQKTLLMYQNTFKGIVYILNHDNHALIGLLKRYNEKVVFSHSKEFKDKLKEFEKANKGPKSSLSKVRRTYVYRVTPSKNQIKEVYIEASEIPKLKNVILGSINGNDIGLKFNDILFNYIPRLTGYTRHLPWSINRILKSMVEIDIEDEINIVYYAQDRKMVSSDNLLELKIKNYLKSKYDLSKLVSNSYDIKEAKIYNTLGFDFYQVPNSASDEELVSFIKGNSRTDFSEVKELPIMKTVLGKMIRTCISDQILTNEDLLELKQLIKDYK